MNFEFSDEQKMLRQTARDFVDKEIMPYMAEWDEKGSFDPAIWKKLADLGLMAFVCRKNTAAAAWTITHLPSYVKSWNEVTPLSGRPFPYTRA